jgi:sigma-B regulation protein RsbU (phosphoserine phosphatase)
MTLMEVGPYLQEIATLAEVWLSTGAASFSFWAQGELVRQWTNGQCATETRLSAPIRVNGKTFAELRVTCDPETNEQLSQKRLQADAALLARLLPLENDRSLLAEELVNTRDQLISLYSLTEATRSTIVVEHLLRLLAVEASRLLKARGAFFLLDIEDRTRLAVSHPDENINQQKLFEISHQVYTQKRPQIFKGNVTDGCEDSNHILLVPFKVYNAHSAVLGITKDQNQEFMSPDIKLARAIADYAGAHIENRLMVRSNLELVRLETEIELAQKIQSSLLPKAVPEVPGVEIWVTSQPASRIGGDFYDFIHQPNGAINFVVGDISGKGMPAALLMAMTLKVIRSEAAMPGSPNPDQIIQRSNVELYQDYSDAIMFSTLFVGQYFPETRRLSFSNAGHSPVIYCPAGGRPEMLRADAVPIGLFGDINSSNAALTLNPGDVLVLATDGINETSNADNRLFGFTRLMLLAGALSGKSAHEIGQGILEEVEMFGADKTQEDDRTLMVIKGL